jgi:hypothetical protein
LFIKRLYFQSILAQDVHSGVRIPPETAFFQSFRPVPLVFPQEPAGKPTEGGSSIPEGISPYRNQDYSHFFPEAENLRKRTDPTGNNRERIGNVPKIRRIPTDSSSKRVLLSDLNHISKKNTKNPALGFLFHESHSIREIHSFGFLSHEPK